MLIYIKIHKRIFLNDKKSLSILHNTKKIVFLHKNNAHEKSVCTIAES